MKKSLSILIGIGILLAGVWVFKTRTPVDLNSTETTVTESPTPMESYPAAVAALSALETSADKKTDEATPAQKIAQTLKPAEQRKLLILDEIMRSKNDNDPRLDTEFKNMTPDLKRAMTQFYSAIAPEGRNERGTIAFLYARSMNKPEDAEFMKTVLFEKPCLSLADCSKDAPPASREEEHLQGITETTANYPQLTMIRQSVDRYLSARGENPPNTPLAEAIIQKLHECLNAPNPLVQQEAQRVLKYLKRL